MVNNKKITIITQARLGSSRFPNKILKLINKKTLIEHHIDSLQKIKNIDNIIVATTKEKNIDKLINILKKKEINYFQGSQDNVLERFYYSLNTVTTDYVVRVTSDCPLIDYRLAEKIIEHTVKNNLDYCSNILVENYPDGQDIEVFSFASLKLCYENAVNKIDLEHVTTYIRRNSTFNGGNIFKSDNFPCLGNFNEIRMTVDEPIDLEAIKILIIEVGEYKPWYDYANYIIENKKKFKNQNIIRNEGFLKSLKK